MYCGSVLNAEYVICFFSVGRAAGVDGTMTQREESSIQAKLICSKWELGKQVEPGNSKFLRERR
jgi:hypothetical protein